MVYTASCRKDVAFAALQPQIFNLKFTAKQLARSAVKCEKDEKAEKLKVEYRFDGSLVCMHGS